MNIALLQAATGEIIEGPTVRVPFGNYRIEKSGSYKKCDMIINNQHVQELNGKLILSNNSNIKLTAFNAEGLSVQFVREK